MSIGHILFGFEGRLNRAPWWGYTILATIASWLLQEYVLRGLATVLVPTPNGAALFSLLGSLPFLWIAVALGVKRLHDRDKSGKLLLVYYLIPYLILLLSLYVLFGIAGLASVTGPSSNPAASVTSALGSRFFLLMLLWLVALGISVWSLIDLGFLEGTPGWNRYGPDPTAKPFARSA